MELTHNQTWFCLNQEFDKFTNLFSENWLQLICMPILFYLKEKRMINVFFSFVTYSAFFHYPSLFSTMSFFFWRFFSQFSHFFDRFFCFANFFGTFYFVFFEINYALQFSAFWGILFKNIIFRQKGFFYLLAINNHMIK